MFTPPFVYEVIIILFANAIQKIYKGGKRLLTKIFKLLITLSCVYLPFTIYMNLNTQLLLTL